MCKIDFTAVNYLGPVWERAVICFIVDVLRERLSFLCECVCVFLSLLVLGMEFGI